MMKKFTLLLLLSFQFLIFNFSFAQAPDWAWAKSAGSVSNDYSNAVCTDASGNVYVTGTFQGSSITFGGQEFKVNYRKSFACK